MPDLIDTPLARIASNPKILGGKPVIRGTRIPVSLILNFVANGMVFREILQEYPQLSEDDLKPLCSMLSESPKAKGFSMRLLREVELLRRMDERGREYVQRYPTSCAQRSETFAATSQSQ